VSDNEKLRYRKVKQIERVRQLAYESVDWILLGKHEEKRKAERA
jgi:hypothetical protein